MGTPWNSTDKAHKEVILLAICCIAILAGIAMFKGFNGIILSAALAAIAGLAGWMAPQLKLR